MSKVYLHEKYNTEETKEIKEIIDIIIKQTYGEKELNNISIRAILGELIRKYIVAGSKTPPEAKARIIIIIARIIAEDRIQNPAVLPEEIPYEISKIRKIKYPEN